MSTTTNQTAAVSSTSKRIILASAYCHERHSTGRQERAVKTLRKMGRFDDETMKGGRKPRITEPADDCLDL